MLFRRILFLAFGASAALGADLDVSRLPEPATHAVDFARDIQPLLEKRCVKCHGEEKQKGGLRLDSRADALKGGDTHGPDIVPGKSAESPLVHFVAGLDADMLMPPERKGEPLSKDDVALLRAWIDQGAPWPESAALRTGALEARSLHWAFQPLHRPIVPAAASINPIDAFLSAKLIEQGLTMAPEADARTLCRRLYFDLIGLPPTPEEVAAFEQEHAVDAAGSVEKLVDRLLASPRYGERWARHWLDVVRFAESDGFETNQPRPDAWPYRDYVIAAFNADLPYDRFVREQIAGDALGADEATGFLVGGAWDRVKSPDPVLTANQRADELHDMVSVTGATFLGLTVGCARCHDHKFDPIPQKDYYALKACFAGVQHGERAVLRPDSLQREREADSMRGRLAETETALDRLAPAATPSAHEPHRVAVNALRNVERFVPLQAKRLRFTIEQTNNSSEPCIDELEVWTAGPQPRNVARTTVKVTSSGDYQGNPSHKLEHLVDGRFGNGRSWISNTARRGWVEVEFARTESIERVVWGRDREGKYKDRLPTRYRIELSDGEGDWRVVADSADRASFVPDAVPKAAWDIPALTVEARADAERIENTKRELERGIAERTAERKVYAGTFERPPATYRLSRGDPMQPKEEVAPSGFSEIGGVRWELPTTAPEQERRLALAKWIASLENPLTARVIVNRLWHYHFGRGIVDTPSDFGINGGRPSHPELLDWLASELITRGWSLKAMHRLICTSAAYRQASSVVNPAAQSVDASNRLLWHFPAHRLEAEPLRDAILATSGRLDLHMGGPGFDLFQPNSNYVKVYDSRQEFGPDTFRRMVYQAKPRMQLDDTFGTFDCPDAGQIAPRRNVSTTPLQALSLLNSPFALQQSQFFAERLEREAGHDAAAQVSRAFALAFSREPAPEESAAACALIATHGLPAFCRALLNAHEFITIR